MWVSAIDLGLDIVLFATTDWSSYNKRKKKTDYISFTCHVDNNLLVAAKNIYGTGRRCLIFKAGIIH